MCSNICVCKKLLWINQSLTNTICLMITCLYFHNSSWDFKLYQSIKYIISNYKINPIWHFKCSRNPKKFSSSCCYKKLVSQLYLVRNNLPFYTANSEFSSRQILLMRFSKWHLLLIMMKKIETTTNCLTLRKWHLTSNISNINLYFVSKWVE